MSATSTGDERAMTILSELHTAEKELVGKAVVLTDGKAGTIDQLFLDDEHGLRIATHRELIARAARDRQDGDRQLRRWCSVRDHPAGPGMKQRQIGVISPCES
jgi:hypothetical protein